jgi:hypothetical protein
VAAVWLEVRVRWRSGTVTGWYAVIADPEDPEDMQKLGADAVRRDHSWQKRDISDYEVEVRMRDTHRPVVIFVPRQV